jgi:hypothetical protein
MRHAPIAAVLCMLLVIPGAVEAFDGLWPLRGSFDGVWIDNDYRDLDEGVPAHIVLALPLKGRTACDPVCRYVLENAGLAMGSLTVTFSHPVNGTEIERTYPVRGGLVSYTTTTGPARVWQGYLDWGVIGDLMLVRTNTLHGPEFTAELGLGFSQGGLLRIDARAIGEATLG